MTASIDDGLFLYIFLVVECFMQYVLTCFDLPSWNILDTLCVFARHVVPRRLFFTKNPMKLGLLSIYFMSVLSVLVDFCRALCFASAVKVVRLGSRLALV